MERENRGKGFLMYFLLAVLLSQEAATLVMCRSLQGSADKNTYSPVLCHSQRRPHRRPPCETPSPGSGGNSGTPTPSHGTGGDYNSPPTSGSGHGSGGYYNSPPASGSGGGSGGGSGSGSGSGGGSGGGSSSPTPVIVTPPSSPGFDPGTQTPTIPIVPPSPTTPGIFTPPSPLIPNPNIPPFIIGPVIYWRTHPLAIWAIFGYWSNIGQLFGTPATSLFGRNLSLQEALANTRTDGIGALFREGTASFLNSMVGRRFPFSTQQVRDAFTASLASNKAAAAQAELFKLANEGHLKKNK